MRHGLPVRKENTDGPADPELSVDGHAQAALFAAYMMSESVDAIYSSPLRRAVQTAEPLSVALGIEPILVPGIAEWDQHSNEYIPVEELKAANDPRWLEMAKGGFSSDEIPEDFHNRVLESVEGFPSIAATQLLLRVMAVSSMTICHTYLALQLHSSFIRTTHQYIV